jgi:modulator of FtsH protease HflC
MSSSTNKNLFLILIVALIAIASVSLFVVREGQTALLLRFGKMAIDHKTNKPYVYGPGLHVKVPFITQTKKLDARLQTLDMQSSRILTAEQKYVLVDYYVKWRIKDFPLYYTRTGGNSFRAESLLSQKINDALRAQFGVHTISEVIADDRENIMSALRTQADVSAEGLGISVIDVRIKRIDLPQEVSQSVFSRMRADREKVAAQHRADGKAQAEAIRAKADATATVIVAKAKADAANIRAQGDKEAGLVYIKAYGKNYSFYNFYRSLKSYTDVFNDNKSVLVLNPNGHFFDFFADQSFRVDN